MWHVSMLQSTSGQSNRSRTSVVFVSTMLDANGVVVNSWLEGTVVVQFDWW